jgi:hypothetical protein
MRDNQTVTFLPLFSNWSFGAHFQSCGMTSAQIATMPTNNTIEDKAAASSTNVRNMTKLLANTFRLNLPVLAQLYEKGCVTEPGTYEEQCSFFVLKVNSVPWDA